MGGNKGDASSSTSSKRKMSLDGQRATIASAKAERGRVKVHNWRNTMLYYTSSHNPSNALTMELICNAMPLPSSTLNSSYEGGEKGSMLVFVYTVLIMQNDYTTLRFVKVTCFNQQFFFLFQTQLVPGRLWMKWPNLGVSNIDAHNVDASNVILLSNTSEGGDNAKHVVDLP